MSRPRTITPDQVHEIRRLLAWGTSLDDIARMCGVNKKTVGNIKYNRGWYAEVPVRKITRAEIIQGINADVEVFL